MIVHYVNAYTGPDKGPGRQRWTALCGVNNQRPKPATDEEEQVTCKRCLGRLTRPERAA